MKNLSLFILLNFVCASFVYAQNTKINNNTEKEIYSLIDKYVRAREKKDTVLLDSILSDDIDQLVSTGEWRIGKAASFKGMMQSSTSNPGERTIKIEKIRIIDPEVGIADARYEIQNPDGSARKMWSTFIVVKERETWKIAAIRNMLIPGK